MHGAKLLDRQLCSLYLSDWLEACCWPLGTDLRPVMRLQFPLSLQTLQAHLLLQLIPLASLTCATQTLYTEYSEHSTRVSPHKLFNCSSSTNHLSPGGMFSERYSLAAFLTLAPSARMNNTRKDWQRRSRIPLAINVLLTLLNASGRRVFTPHQTPQPGRH